MDFLSNDKIGLFIILFLPGFISVKVHRLLIADEKYDFSKNLFEIVGYSLINFILSSWLIALNVLSDWIWTRSWGFWLSSILILTIFPIFWPIILNKFLQLKSIKQYVVSNSKSAWDFHFTKREGAWIIVHLKDGRKVGGKFGSKSFAAPYPCKESIYLEELWNLDKDKFISQVPRTNGILIISDDIFAIEFFT